MKNLCLSKLNLNKEEIFNSISKLSTAELSNKSHGWSVAQHLYHCWLVECLTEKYINNKIINPESISSVSVITYVRSFLLQLFLKSGYKVKAPKPTAIFPDSINIIKLNSDWEDSRKSMDNLITRLCEMKLENKGFFRHPIIGRLNLQLTLNFLQFHLKHHIKQIEKIIPKIKS